MNRQSLLLITLLTSLSIVSKSQSITSANFKISDREKGIRSIELFLDNNLILGLNSKGQFEYIDSSVEKESLYYEDYDATTTGISGKSDEKIKIYQKLKVTYYNDFIDHGDNGKIKSIEGIPVTYYNDYNLNDPKGAIKSIGNLRFSYYNKFNINNDFGALKTIGPIAVTYYTTFDINDPQGRVKSIGKVNIKYFNKFDSDALFGKIKSIKGNTKALYVTR